MKAFKLLSILLLLAISSGSTFAQDEVKKKVDKVTFKTSIDCEDCVNTIMNSVPLEKGIRNVVCDLETKEVMVEYKTKKTDKKKVKRMIEKLGYTAEEVKKKKSRKERSSDDGLKVILCESLKGLLSG